MGRMHAQTCHSNEPPCLLRSSFARETEMKPAAGGRERPGRSLHTQCVVETPDRCPSGQSCPVRVATGPLHVGHGSGSTSTGRRCGTWLFMLRSDFVRARGRSRERAESRCRVPPTESDVSHVATTSVVAHVHVAGSDGPRGGPPRGARSRECCRFHVCDGFFLGTDSTLQTRPQNGARPCAIMHLWHARGPRAYGRRALSTIERTQTQGIRGHAGYSLNSLPAGSVRHESCQLIRHVRDHTLSPSLGASHVARAAGCGGAVNA